MKISTAILKELIAGGEELMFKLIEDKLTDTTRWSTIHRVIVQHEGRFFKSTYSRGATEYQDERPYEYSGEFEECPEVFPVEVTHIEYREAVVPVEGSKKRGRGGNE